jgi:hypothetical protein
MTPEKLEKGNQLLKLIEKTEEALNNFVKLIESGKPLTGGDGYKTDMHYNLCISEYRDGSGIKADLSRYFGNTVLLNIISNEISRQLEEMKADFEAL